MSSELKFDTWQDKSGTAQSCVINQAFTTYYQANDVYNTFTANNSTYDTPLTITYTPLRSNSMLYINATTAIRAIAPYGLYGGIKRDGTKMTGAVNYDCLDFIYKAEAVNHHYNLNFRTSVLSGSTSATTFTVWLGAYDTGNGEMSQGYGQHVIQILEVAQ
jgi:hypothetical protein